MPRVLDAIQGPKGYEYKRTFGPPLRHLRSRIANTKNNNGVTRIMISPADSFIEGYGQTSVANSIVTKVRTAAQQIWRPGGEGYIPSVTSGGIATRWTLVNGSQADFGLGLGRRSFYMDSATASATLTFSGDRFELWYTQGPNNGNMKVSIDGGAFTLFSTFNATVKSSQKWTSPVLTRGTHTIVVMADNTLAGHLVYSTFLDGAMIFDNDYTVGVQIIASGKSGYRTADFYNPTLSDIANFWATGMDSIQPDAVIIPLCLNDLGLGSVTPAQAKINLVGIIETNIMRNGTLNTPYTGVRPSFVLVPYWARSDSITSLALAGTVTSGPDRITDASANWAAPNLAGYFNAPGALITKSAGTAVLAADTRAVFVDATHIGLSKAPISNGTITYTLTFTDDQWEPYRRAIMEVCRDNSYALWDMYAVFGYIGADLDSLTYDKLHPNDTGAQAIATELVQMLTGVTDSFAMWRGDVNAKGDTLVATGDNQYSRFPIGLEGQTEVPRANAPMGKQWESPWSSQSHLEVIKNPGLATVTAIGHTAPTLTATAANADSNVAPAGPWLQFTSGAVSGNTSGMISAFNLCTAAWMPVEFSARILTTASVALLRLWVGLFSASPDASATPALSLAAFRYDTTADSASAFWRCVGDNGSGAPSVVAVTNAVGAVTANTVYNMRVVIYPGIVTTIDFYINGVLVGTVTTKVPVPSTGLGYALRVTTLTAAAKSISVGRVGLAYGAG